MIKIHHSQLDPEEKDICVCNACGSDEIRHTSDVGYCGECHSVEDYASAYYGKDGEVYRNHEIDWGKL